MIMFIVYLAAIFILALITLSIQFIQNDMRGSIDPDNEKRHE